MANYVRTGPFTNGGAPGISASFLNNIENVFEQPSGGTETGKYFLAGSAYTTGATISYYVVALSRTSTPLSVTIDTADTSPTGIVGPTTGHLSANGFQVYSTSTAAGTNVGCGGNYTLSF